MEMFNNTPRKRLMVFVLALTNMCTNLGCGIYEEGSNYPKCELVQPPVEEKWTGKAKLSDVASEFTLDLFVHQRTGEQSTCAESPEVGLTARMENGHEFSRTNVSFGTVNSGFSFQVLLSNFNESDLLDIQELINTDPSLDPTGTYRFAFRGTMSFTGQSESLRLDVELTEISDSSAASVVVDSIQMAKVSP
jgi:hypothetical protein